jgi:hypothetical protein
MFPICIWAQLEVDLSKRQITRPGAPVERDCAKGLFYFGISSTTDPLHSGYPAL